MLTSFLQRIRIGLFLADTGSGCEKNQKRKLQIDKSKEQKHSLNSLKHNVSAEKNKGGNK